MKQLLIGICPVCQGVSEVSAPCTCPESKAPPLCRVHGDACAAVQQRCDRLTAKIDRLEIELAEAKAWRAEHEALEAVFGAKGNVDKVHAMARDAIAHRACVALGAAGVRCTGTIVHSEYSTCPVHDQ